MTRIARDDYDVPSMSGYLPGSGVIAAQAASMTTDGNGVTYGPMRTSDILYGKYTTAGDTPVVVNSFGDVITETMIHNAIRSGQGFCAATGVLTLTSSSAATYGFSFFSPAAQSSKNIFVYSMKFADTGTTNSLYVQATTTDPTGTGTWHSITPNTNQLGTGTSVLSGSNISYTTQGDGGVTQGGTTLDSLVYGAGIGSTELVPSGSGYLLTKSAAHGIALYFAVPNASSGIWTASVKWIEI